MCTLIRPPAVSGATYQFAETQDLPLQVTYGYSKEKRPDLKQCVLSTLCVDRAVPMWGQPEDGNASDKTLNTTLLSEIAQLLAQYGVQPGASISIADAALVTEDNLAALRDTLFITRLPATYSACARIIAEAVAHNHWEVVGVLAQTPPTKHRPGTFYKVAEGEVTLYGKPYRAVVVHSSSQDQRRQQHLAREIQASYATLEATVRAAARQEYCCHADAEAAAAKLRALQSAYHGVEVAVQERPKYGPGRPSSTRPRVVKALRYGLQVTLHERAEVIARKTQETGCCVLLTNVPTAGEMAHRAGDVLRAYKEQHGIEQNVPRCLRRVAQTVHEVDEWLRSHRFGQDQCSTCAGLVDRGHHLAPKDRHHHPCREEKPVVHCHPLPRRGQPTPCHKTMAMWRQQQGLTPRVQRGDDPWWRAPIRGGCQQGAQGIAHGLQQQGGQHRHLGQPQGIAVMGQGEEDMGVITGQEPHLSESQPALGLERRAWGTRSVATGVVPDAGPMAVRTRLWIWPPRAAVRHGVMARAALRTGAGSG